MKLFTGKSGRKPVECYLPARTMRSMFHRVATFSLQEMKSMAMQAHLKRMIRSLSLHCTVIPFLRYRFHFKRAIGTTQSKLSAKILLKKTAQRVHAVSIALNENSTSILDQNQPFSSPLTGLVNMSSSQTDSLIVTLLSSRVRQRRNSWKRVAIAAVARDR